MIIPILYEANFKEKSIWCEHIRIGIEQYALMKKYQLMQIDGDCYSSFDYASFFQSAPRLVLVVGSSPAWIEDALNFFERENIKVVLLDSFNTEHPAVCARIKTDYRSLVCSVLRHLHDCGCTRHAIYGCFIHSSADVEKVKLFLGEIKNASSEICFENKSDLENCYLSFKPHINEFDSVICVNEFAAASLVEHLRADGIRVPEDIQIISCGSGTSLGKIISPSLTTLSSTDAILGRTALSAFKYCYSSFDVPCNLLIELNYVLKPGESTKPLLQNFASSESHASVSVEPSREELQINFYTDPEIQRLSKLEKALRYCDETDISILKMLMSNISYDKIAESLYISRSSIFYRLKRIEENLSLASHSRLKDYLTENKFLAIFDKV